jgi:Fe-S-cluster containining protein
MRWARIRKRGLLLDRAIDNDPPCRDCDGVCCRSFPSVSLSWGEYERLRALGAQRLQFTFAGAWLIIENGCEFQIGARCGIYPHRPEVCRRFVCFAGEDPFSPETTGNRMVTPPPMPLA